MNIIEWFKNLFSKKKKIQYNLLIVRSKTQPTFKDNGEKTVILTSSNQFSIKDSNVIPEGQEFCALESDLVGSEIVGKNAPLWYIITTFNRPEYKLGDMYVYPKLKDKKSWNWYFEKDQDLVQSNAAKVLKESEDTVPEGDADTTDVKSANAEFSDEQSEEQKASGVKEEDAPAETETESKAKTELNVEDEVKEEETPAEPKAEDTVAPKVEEELTSANIDEIKKLIADELQKLVGKNVKINMANSIEKMLELLAERISNLRDNADNYKREAKQNEEAFKTVENERVVLQDAYDKLKEEKKELERKKGGLQNDLEKAKRDADTNEKKLKEGFEAEKKELNSEKDILNSEKDGLQKELDELRKTDAGQLKAELETTKTELETTKAGRDAALKDAETKQATIDSKQAEIENLKTEKNDLNNQLNNAKAQAKQFESELNTAKSTIDKKVKEVSELTAKNNELSGNLEKANGDLKDTTEKLNVANHQITSLNSTIGARDITIGKLNGDVAKLTDEKKTLNVTLDSDIESQTAIYSSAAKALVDAVAGDFLSECDPDAETDTVQSMCGKIRRGVQSFADAVEALGKKEFKSTTELTKAYDELVAENIKGHAFTEIARWWAYSRLPFVADRDREEGRTVSMKAINAAYAALSRILALADYRYQIPALFVENLNEGDYQDMTGREQLNLDYQFPNVRTHAESIDRGDRANTVLDIVELGYYKGTDLVKKTSVII